MRLNHTLIPHISRQTGGPTLGKTRCVKNYTLWLERKKKRKNGRGVGKIRKNKFITNNNRNRFIFFVNSNLQASLARTCFEKNDITLCRWLWFCAKFTTDRQYVWENGLEWVGLFFSDTPSNSPLLKARTNSWILCDRPERPEHILAERYRLFIQNKRKQMILLGLVWFSGRVRKWNRRGVFVSGKNVRCESAHQQCWTNYGWTHKVSRFIHNKWLIN